MRSLNPVIARILIAAALISSVGACKEKEEFNSVYELDPFNAVPSSYGKNKEKTDEQYISILYSNLFQTAISSKKLSEMVDAIYSVGDKEVAHELIVAKFMAEPNLKLPSNAEMRNNTDQFLEEAYKRFFVRNISEAEREWFKNFIKNNPEVTVEFVYTAFALSNEYQFY
ncbi:MAG TPA: hypothetical protein VFV37_09465 [Luteibaculaceae bacterium]|jgi:hypothetical protein|nr:hypothetical protein [Luteibaculaceae bacterium]